MTAAPTVAVLGLGEVGRILVEDLSPRVAPTVRAWDIAFADASSIAARNAHELRVLRAQSSTASVESADVVISAVTAANTVAAARDAADGLRSGSWFFDLNSASPERKRGAASIVAAAGGRYVECAVMAPIELKRSAVPILLGGPDAREAEPIARSLGLSGVRVYSERFGVAAATKLSRSIVVKGLEALLAESMLTACAWGVEADVLGSLSNLFPVENWPELARYMVSRAFEHGTRRAEEMREAAATVADLGEEPIVAAAVAERQAWAATFADLAGLDSVGAMMGEVSKRSAR